MTDYHALRASIALEALPLAVGTTVSVLCPKCGGGTSKERKLSLTRSYNGAMYMCHRASCGFRGFVSMDGTGSSKDTLPSKPTARPFTGQLHPLEDFIQDDFVRQYKGFKDGECQEQLYTDGCGNLVFTCRGFNGEVLGHVTRSQDKTIRTYRAREGTDMYSYYAPVASVFKPGVLFIVEDCISAMCIASHGYNALALLGTHLSDQVRTAIIDNGVMGRVFLDPDAATKALAIANRLPSGRAIIGHTKDPKDLADLDKLLWEYA